MKLVQTVAPINSPLSLEEVKAHLRLLQTEEDALIEGYIATALAEAEGITGRAFAPATFSLYFDTVPMYVTLPKPPFIELISIETKEYDIWKEMTEYTLDAIAEPATIEGIKANVNGKNSLRVTYRTGYENIPEAIKTWLKVRVATLYEYRERLSEISVMELPKSHVDNLLNEYKVY